MGVVAEGEVEQPVHGEKREQGEEARLRALRSASSNWPPNTIRYPGGQRRRADASAAARFSTVPARSAPATFAVSMATRCDVLAPHQARARDRSARRATSSRRTMLARRRRHRQRVRAARVAARSPSGKRTTTREVEPALDDLAGLACPGRAPPPSAPGPPATAHGAPCASRSKSIRSCGTVACSWLRGRRCPARRAASLRARRDRPRRTARSGPNTLTARFVLLPEIMWSMRWLIGWPKVTLTPGMVRHRRAHLGEQLLLRAGPGRSTTSISEALTPWTCSSFSARPVRRLVETTSGKASSASSTWRPSASLSSSGDARRAHQADP